MTDTLNINRTTHAYATHNRTMVYGINSDVAVAIAWPGAWPAS